MKTHKIVEYEDIDNNANGSVTVSTTSVQLLPTRLGRHRRKQLIISNTSATTVTLCKGDQVAVANEGIRLQQNQTYIEADDAGYDTWQGAIQAIASASSTVVYTETVVK